MRTRCVTCLVVVATTQDSHEDKSLDHQVGCDAALDCAGCVDVDLPLAEAGAEADDCQSQEAATGRDGTSYILTKNCLCTKCEHVAVVSEHGINNAMAVHRGKLSLGLARHL